MEYIKAFAAGFVSTVTFHQGVLAALHGAGLWPKPAWPMSPTKPFQIPAVISLALWGGVWGIALWCLLLDTTGLNYWAFAVAFGAVAPSLAALLIVFPLKGLPLAGGWDSKVIVPVLILNGAWGFGAAFILRSMVEF